MPVVGLVKILRDVFLGDIKAGRSNDQPGKQLHLDAAFPALPQFGIQRRGRDVTGRRRADRYDSLYMA